MPRQFADLPGAATLATRQFQLTAQIVDDLVAVLATGVVHGPAGTGKTYAVQAALEQLRDPAPADPDDPAGRRRGWRWWPARWRSPAAPRCAWSPMSWCGR